MNLWPKLIEELSLTPLDSQSEALSTAPLSLCCLDHKSALEVIGPDSKTFLQGQLSCDLNELSEQQWRLGSHCNHKGRMLSSFRASAINDEHIRLIMRDDIAQNAQTALAKYAIFSKAELKPAGLLGLGISGSAAQECLSHWQLTIPEAGQHRVEKDIQLLAIDENRYELWTSAETLIKLLKPLKSEAPLADNNYWKLLDIRAGIAEIEAGTVETFIPQMLNFNELGGISYQKGCYTGQEIIARMQYRGNLKRHTVRLSSDQTALDGDHSAFISGAQVFCADSQSAVGELANVALSPNGIEVLAVIKDDAQSKALGLSKNGPWILAVESLPYAIT